MKFRHEWKHEINYSDFLVLRQRLRAVAKPDVHAQPDGSYLVRSLYFDNLSDQALREKIDGVNRREKFRIRYYNDDISHIQLEKKSKYNGLCSKEAVTVSEETVRRILKGDNGALLESGQELEAELYSKMLSKGLLPKTIVEYMRMPFVFAPGNVRITLDYQIRTGICCRDFLNMESVTIEAAFSPVILEVKWDEFLPDIIRDAIQLRGCRTGAFSKYAACRIYG